VYFLFDRLLILLFLPLLVSKGLFRSNSKKTKGKELSLRAKRKTKNNPLKRIGAEHGLGGINVFRIVHDTLRTAREDFDNPVMETGYGLHNRHFDFRLIV